jgi:hypothetical protein
MTAEEAFLPSALESPAVVSHPLRQLFSIRHIRSLPKACPPWRVAVIRDRT